MPGWSRAPAGLRDLGIVDRLAAALGGARVEDAGDLRIDPGFRPDDDPRAKNLDHICEYLPRERDLMPRAWPTPEPGHGR